MRLITLAKALILKQTYEASSDFKTPILSRGLFEVQTDCEYLNLDRHLFFSVICMETNMLDAEIKNVDATTELHVINIQGLTAQLKSYIDDHISLICEGDSDTDTDLVKTNFINYLASKDERTQLGSVAEFFVHLYLRQHGFKQEFLFFNLEEGSIKKGFDGYFSKGHEEYLLESKSGKSTTKSISHKNKIKEAYNDVKSTVSGTSKKSQNNPWRNAYNHASHIDVNTKKGIRKKIKELSDLFDSGIYKSIEEFNVIPCSTIFLDGTWDSSFSESIHNQDHDFLTKIKAKSKKVVCVTKNSYPVFLDYLEGK